jgi:hypothetical protein
MGTTWGFSAYHQRRTTGWEPLLYTIWSFNLKFVKHIPEKLYPADDEKKQLRYFGQLHNGIPHGYGTMAWKDGQIYKGTYIIKIMINLISGLIYVLNCFNCILYSNVPK